MGSVQPVNGNSAFSSPSANPNWLTCVTPPQTAYGPYQVSVSLDGGMTWTNDLVYYYYIQNGTCSVCQNGNCQNGFCTCISGWTGTSCNVPDCSSLQNCNGHGNCTSPNVCTCQSGWTEVNCNQPFCSSCINGVCSGPNTCTCNEGWNGTSCNVPICNPPCNTTAHYICIEPNVCACAVGYSGSNCNISFNATCTGVPGGCVNGNCIATNVCRCFPGWLSNNCSVPDCSQNNNCSGNGICINPEQCQVTHFNL